MNYREQQLAEIVFYVFVIKGDAGDDLKKQLLYTVSIVS